MPPKERFTRETILDAAWAIARRDGISALSARGVAAKLGASTAPLYRQFESMADLEREVVDRAVAHMRDAVMHRRVHEDPAINNGVLFALYARNEPVLFHSLMLTVHDHSAKLDELAVYWVEQAAAHPRYASIEGQALTDLMDHLGLVMLGVAAQAWTGRWPDADVAFFTDLITRITEPLIEAVRGS